MGDRCWIRVYLRKQDLEKFNEATGWSTDYEELDDGDDGQFSLEISEVNYGGDDQLGMAAGAGIRFHGQHGPGNCYGPGMFASDGHAISAIDLDLEGYVTVRYDPETGMPADEAGDKLRIKRFAVKLRQAKRFIKGKGTDGGT